MWLPTCDVINYTGQQKKSFLLLVKIQGDSHSFDIAESKYDTQIGWSPTNGKGRDYIQKLHL
jgi:hypothetical protein